MHAQFDRPRNAIIVNNTEKNGKPRAFRASQKLLNMLNGLPKKTYNVFGKANYNYMENQFVVTRKRDSQQTPEPKDKADSLSHS
jgi:hypothetical protein